MFGFLKKLLGGGAKSTAPVNDDGVLSITPDDLESPARLGPKLAVYARMQAHITDAGYDPETEAVKVSYVSGFEGSVFMKNMIPAMRAMNSGEEVAVYLENTFANIDVDPEGVLLPVLKPISYIETAREQMHASGLADDQPLATWYQQVAPELVKILVRDTPAQMQIVTRKALADEGLDDAAASAQALASLADYVNDRELGVLAHADGKLLQWRLDDNYEASLFFLPGVWDYQQQELGGAPAAIFAARNLVFFANSADPEAMAILDIVATTEGDAPAYAIAPGQIWLWQDRGWVPYEKPAEQPPVLH